MNCPICKKQINIFNNSSSVEDEIEIVCANGCERYSYFQYCGSYLQVIGEYYFQYDYSSSMKLLRKQQIVSQRVIRKEREQYVKKLRLSS